MILIALGSNLPFAGAAPREVLEAALDSISREGIVVVARSRFYTAAASPPSEQPRYVNAVARVETSLTPAALMRILHLIEDRFGRVRGAPNAARTLDLDLLDYDGQILDGPLMLPHPRLAGRGFVLLPLAEVAPGWVHPVSGQSVTELITALPPQDARPI